MPFVLSQLVELIFSVLVVAGVDLYGVAPKEDMMANSNVPEDDPVTFSQLSGQMQAFTVIGHVLTLSIKVKQNQVLRTDRKIPHSLFIVLDRSISSVSSGNASSSCATTTPEPSANNVKIYGLKTY